MAYPDEGDPSSCWAPDRPMGASYPAGDRDPRPGSCADETTLHRAILAVGDRVTRTLHAVDVTDRAPVEVTAEMASARLRQTITLPV